MAERVDAVVLGLSPTGLYAARELCRAGRRVLGVDADAACATHSSALQQHWRLPDDAALLARLGELAATQAAPPVLLPTSDRYIEFVLRHNAALRDAYHFPESYGGGAALLLDKREFHRLCQRHDMATPGVWEVADAAALEAVAGDIVYPCIAKPVLIHRARAWLRGHKVLLARSRAELAAHFARLPADVGGWIVQEVIPGPESAITLYGAYVARDGAIRQAFSARKLRQYPPGFGSASLAASTRCEETEALAQGFLRDIGFRGVCGVEFKRDLRDGALKMIEVNPRPTLWFQLAHAAGKRIADAAVRDLRGEAAAPERAQREDVRWRYLLKDLAAAWFYRRHGRDFVFPPPRTRGSAAAQVWAVFDWHDPLPALAELGVYARKAWRRR